MTTIPCPCCGGPLAVPASLMALHHVLVNPSERIVLDLFIAAFPRGVDTPAIANAIWGLDPNGGPENITNGISVRINRINKAIGPLGWRIAAPVGHNVRALAQAPLAVARAA